MECYAINRNGVLLFRNYESNYNVYKNDTNLVVAVDSITANMTVSEVTKIANTTITTLSGN